MDYTLWFSSRWIISFYLKSWIFPDVTSFLSKCSKHPLTAVTCWHFSSVFDNVWLDSSATKLSFISNVSSESHSCRSVLYRFECFCFCFTEQRVLPMLCVDSDWHWSKCSTQRRWCWIPSGSSRCESVQQKYLWLMLSLAMQHKTFYQCWRGEWW